MGLELAFGAGISTLLGARRAKRAEADGQAAFINSFCQHLAAGLTLDAEQTAQLSEVLAGEQFAKFLSGGADDGQVLDGELATLVAPNSLADVRRVASQATRQAIRDLGTRVEQTILDDLLNIRLDLQNVATRDDLVRWAEEAQTERDRSQSRSIAAEGFSDDLTGLLGVLAPDIAARRCIVVVGQLSAEQPDLAGFSHSVAERQDLRLKTQAQTVSEPLRILAALSAQFYVTLDVGNRLERALIAMHGPDEVSVVVNAADIPFSFQKRVVVIKLRGDVEQPETLVAGTEDHFPRLSSEVGGLVMSLLASAPVLVVGAFPADGLVGAIVKTSERIGVVPPHRFALAINPDEYWRSECVNLNLRPVATTVEEDLEEAALENALLRVYNATELYSLPSNVDRPQLSRQSRLERARGLYLAGAYAAASTELDGVLARTEGWGHEVGLLGEAAHLQIKSLDKQGRIADVSDALERVSLRMARVVDDSPKGVVAIAEARYNASAALAFLRADAIDLARKHILITLGVIDIAHALDASSLSMIGDWYAIRALIDLAEHRRTESSECLSAAREQIDLARDWLVEYGHLGTVREPHYARRFYGARAFIGLAEATALGEADGWRSVIQDARLSHTPLRPAPLEDQDLPIARFTDYGVIAGSYCEAAVSWELARQFPEANDRHGVLREAAAARMRALGFPNEETREVAPSALPLQNATLQQRLETVAHIVTGLDHQTIPPDLLLPLN